MDSRSRPLAYRLTAVVPCFGSQVAYARGVGGQGSGGSLDGLFGLALVVLYALLLVHADKTRRVLHGSRDGMTLGLCALAAFIGLAILFLTLGVTSLLLGAGADYVPWLRMTIGLVLAYCCAWFVVSRYR